MSIELALDPSGRLSVIEDVSNASAASLLPSEISESFRHSNAAGLEWLASSEAPRELPATAAYWRSIAANFFTTLCHTPAPESERASLEIALPTGETIVQWVESAPPMRGLEYLNHGILLQMWKELAGHVSTKILTESGGVQAYLKALNPVWNTVGRVTFHLAENKKSPEYPFAFLATYTHKVSEAGRAQHIPLGRALQEYAGAQNRNALISLLSPVQRAAEKSAFIRELVDSKSIFQPQGWNPGLAYSFLKEIPILEQSGVSVRIPDFWKSGRPPRPRVSVKVGGNKDSIMTQDALLAFKVETTLEGEPLTEEEWQKILSSTEGLIFLKGRWVEVDKDKLQELLAHWKKVENKAEEGVSLIEGLRLISGYNPSQAEEQKEEETGADWSQVVAGDALKHLLEEINNPTASAESDPGPELKAELRPYQRQGVHWLWFMSRLGLGACLADDMGLGKTIQVISLLLALKRQKINDKNSPSLLVVPASLIGNWKGELQKFAPSLTARFAHPSEMPLEVLNKAATDPAAFLKGCDLLIVSYGLLLRLPWLKEVQWNLLILDEAQAIKNPSARQTKAAKELKSSARIALSGTPLENRLGDLWSLFDFLNPGLLGGAKDFSRFVKNRAGLPKNQFAPLRKLIKPYLLRRMKTDKRIIADLPDKTEIKAFCNLTQKQAVLYQSAVDELAVLLDSDDTEGIKRKGLILAFLSRFKQICNHPSQWLGDGAFNKEDSGKFKRLGELCEEIAARQEKTLIFTQYATMAEPLAAYLQEIFGRPGLVLHGGTAVKQRKNLVDQFQTEGGAPFFVLSLKAGGAGLNLTAASHVLHFDRWWNPAVENQATDRAFRIGQKKNVMVQKFICKGTLEERINELISSKVSLAEDVLGEGGEQLLTEMSNSELLNFVALDINAVVAE